MTSGIHASSLAIISWNFNSLSKKNVTKEGFFSWKKEQKASSVIFGAKKS